MPNSNIQVVFHKNEAQKVEDITINANGQEMKGKLTEVGEDFIILLPEAAKKKKGKPVGKKGPAEPVKINFEDIQEAKVLVSFK